MNSAAHERKAGGDKQKQQRGQPDQGVVRDERGQDQPKDRERAQRSSGLKSQQEPRKRSRRFPASRRAVSSRRVERAEAQLRGQQLLQPDRQFADAHAGRVINRVGDRGGGADIGEFANAFDAGRIDRRRPSPAPG